MSSARAAVTAEVPAARRWRDRAACRGVDPELFFPTAESGPVLAEQVARARAVCAGCAVRPQCLAFALRALPYGVAAGLTPEERRALAHRGGVPARARFEVDEPDQAVPVGSTRAEVCAAGCAALRAGRPVRDVAQTFGVSERTAQRWAHRLHAG